MTTNASEYMTGTGTFYEYFNNTASTIATSDGLNKVHSRDTFTVEFLNTFDYILNGVITTLTVGLGLLGNCLSMIILTRRHMKSSTNCYLLSLAIWDSVVLLCTLFLTSFTGIPEFKSYLQQVFPWIIPYIYPTALTAQTSTIWLTVSFTVERYIAVCYPMRASRMCTIRRARLVIIIVSIVSFLYNISRWFEYKTILRENQDTNQTVPEMNSTSLGENPTYERVYYTVLYLPIMCIIPLISLAVLNTFLILAVKRSQQQRREQMNVRQCRENSVTLMLISVVIVFIICQVPALVYNVAFGINKKAVLQSFGYEILSHLRNFLVTFNSAINFILYCVFGQKFRNTFLKTFCRCLLEEKILQNSVRGATVFSRTSSRHRHSDKLEMNPLKSQTKKLKNGELKHENLQEHQTLLDIHNHNSSKTNQSKNGGSHNSNI